jgi:hypothetical protein
LPLLGVITCEIVELEFAYLMANDPDIVNITAIEDSNSLGIIEALELSPC